MIRKSWRRATALAIVVTLAVFTTSNLSVRFANTKQKWETDDTALSRNFGDPSGSAQQKLLLPKIKGHFDWRSVPTKYPVESYFQLPPYQHSNLPRIQYAFENQTLVDGDESVRRQQAIKKAFNRTWTSYKSHAWKKDELAPISGGSKDTFGDWGATLVDSLDTLWIMDFKDEFHEAVEAAIDIDFGPKSGDINMFETIIRYLGGFIAAYDVSGGRDEKLLAKAIEVADMAYASYDTPNRMPVTRWDSKKAAQGQEQMPASSGIIAELASASLEFTRLSQITGDARYFDAATRITNMLETQQGWTELPGMWPVGVDVQNMDLTTGSEFSLGAMADSAYEYLPKMYQLLGGNNTMANQYKRMYEPALQLAYMRIMFRPMVEDQADILIATSMNGWSRGNSGQHLSCFAGGMYALSGKLSEDDRFFEIGRKLSDGCAWVYRNAPLGIMPEIFSMPACPSLKKCDFTGESGSSPFSSVSDGRYILRPEAIESIFYMYRITGDTKYQDVAWQMFEAIEQRTKTDLAYAALRDVMKDPPEQDDSMESFWTAETLKYFYLIFSDPNLISLDDFVFNTEAHPFRIQHS